MKLSILMPCYNEEKNIAPFFEECIKTFKQVKNIEYIFINDGSTDNTLKEIKKIIKKYNNTLIKCLDFSRNFGKESAMLAGFENSNGDFVAVIDTDLQQHPKYILKMLNFLENNPNYDSVSCYQEKRRESKIISFFKKMFYKFINILSETNFKENASDFRVLNRKMVNSIINMKEYFRFSKGIFSWIGFNTYYMPYKVEKRLHGKSSWSFFKLIKYALNGIISFSLAPLKLAIYIGFLSFISSIIYLIFIIIQKLTIGIEISGYATIVCLILLFGGLQMIFIGIIGEYIGRTYIEVKDRPKYIIKDIYSTNRGDLYEEN